MAQANTTSSVISHQSTNTKEHEHIDKPPAHRTVRFTTFLAVIVVCIVVFLALSLGLGLGLGLHRNSAILQNIDSAFNYSSFYGIPDDLPVVASTQLVNTTELDLKTGFVVSNVTQVREFTLSITQGLASPDGYQKPMILINGQFPGPLIEANSGDIIRVNVNNLMANWSIAVHWHGLDQKNSVEMDGVAGITQCGIPPYQNFTYEFSTEGQRGSFWYHSHLSTQYTDGMLGPLIIHDPLEMVPAVDDEKIVFMGDWHHTYSSVLLTSFLNPTSDWSSQPGTEPLPDNILLNGQNTYDCNVQSSIYPSEASSSVCTGGHLYNSTFTQNKTYRLRLINHSTLFSYWFSIDNHTISVVEVDGVEVEPITDRGVYVNVGQRFSIIVTANQTAGNYYMRATLPTSCYLPYMGYNNTALTSGGFRALGIMNYAGIDPTAVPIGAPGNTTNPSGAATNLYNSWVYEGCSDMPFNLTKPMRAAAAYEVSPDNMHYMEYAFRQAQNDNRIFLNTTAWAPMENNATLIRVADPNFFNVSNTNSFSNGSLGLAQQVVLSTNVTSGIQLVINSRSDMQHPWHLHGHTPQIVGWGDGQYGIDGPTTWNLENPLRRDTFTIPALSHIVLRWKNDNPGVWALHCHIAWHMEGGMLMMLAEQPEKLAGIMNGMDPTSHSQFYGFCGVDDDQAFGSYVENAYSP